MADLLSSLPQLAASLPEFLLWAQVLSYAVLVLFFGHISVAGYRGYAHWALRWLFRVLLGLLALVGGIALAPRIPVGSFFRLLQLDVIAGGIGYALLLLAAVWLLSHHVFNVRGIKAEIARLQELLKKAEAAAGQSKRERMKDPLRIAGIVVLAALAVFALMSFRGFPTFAQGLSSLGISPSDLQAAGQLFGTENLPPGCESPATLALRYQSELKAGTLPDAESGVLRAEAEKRGESVLALKQAGGFQLAILVPKSGGAENADLCVARAEAFCGCLRG